MFAAALDAPRAVAQAPPASLLRTVLDRGHLIVGTGSTNPPWHFEDDAGKLTGMDIAMARILAKGLFDDETGRVSSSGSCRAGSQHHDRQGGHRHPVHDHLVLARQFVAFSRPYYIEGAGLMVTPKSKYKT